MDLFGNGKTFEELLPELQQLVRELTIANKLPERGIAVRSKFGEGKDNAGKLISYPIYINEPVYPANENDLKDEHRTQVPLVLVKAPNSKKYNDCIICSLDLFVLQAIGAPSDAELLPRDKSDNDTGKQRLRIPIDSIQLIDWLKQVVQFRIDNYESAADSFGCCGLFEECSNAKECLHENRLYSTACSYRHNLERGRIFYGKNRNVGQGN